MSTTTAIRPPRSVVTQRRHNRSEDRTIRAALPCHVSGAYGNDIKNEVLWEVAFAIGSLDCQFLNYSELLLSKASGNDPGSSLIVDENSRRTRSQDLEIIAGLLSEFGDVGSGKHSFHERYLQDSFLPKLWHRAVNEWLQGMRAEVTPGNVPDCYTKMIRRFEHDAARLEVHLPAAVAQNLLRTGDRKMIVLRMYELDRLLDEYYDFAQTPRKSKTWREISAIMDVKDPAQTISQAIPTAFVYWSTVAVTVIIPGVTIGKAFQHSPHKRGSVKDADFWLLLQNGSLQILSMFTAVIPIHTDHRLSASFKSLTYAFFALSLLCVLGALVLYTIAPTEWSGLLNSLAGSIQAFVIVQVLMKRN